jgi:hypothetical protein
VTTTRLIAIDPVEFEKTKEALNNLIRADHDYMWEEDKQLLTDVYDYLDVMSTKQWTVDGPDTRDCYATGEAGLDGLSANGVGCGEIDNEY